MSKPVSIESKIVGYEVKKPQEVKPAEPQVEQLTEALKRPERLEGTTYKVKVPEGQSLYVTINDVVLNEGTEHETRRPFEIFINSKDVGAFQWVTALTLVISAVFRKGGDVAFLVEELKGVFDPNGGYWKGGGRYVTSIVADIGNTIEAHLQKLGIIETPELDEARKALIAEKRAQYEASKAESAAPAGDYPPEAATCKKCGEKAVVVMDGCQTCLSCGDSKCG